MRRLFPNVAMGNVIVMITCTANYAALAVRELIMLTQLMLIMQP